METISAMVLYGDTDVGDVATIIFRTSDMPILENCPGGCLGGGHFGALDDLVISLLLSYLHSPSFIGYHQKPNSIAIHLLYDQTHSGYANSVIHYISSDSKFI